MAKLLDEMPDIVYSIEIHDDDYSFDYAKENVSVIGKMRKAVRYDLKKLMDSDSPKHKEILKSLVINTVEKKLSSGFQCLLYKNYQISPLNDKNQTALHLAFYNGSRGIISELEDFLKSKHCKVPDQTDYVDAEGLTHLHVVCAMGGIKLVDNYSENTNNINTRYVSSNQWRKFNNGLTPLHFVMKNFEKQNKEMVQILIKRGADMNAVDDMGRTPLHLIARLSEAKNFNKNTLEIMKTLLDSKADINAKDAEGNTPLFKLFTSSTDQLLHIEDDKAVTKLTEVTELKLKFLLEAGADVNAKNNNNDTVLHSVVNYLKNLRLWYLDSDFKLDDTKVIQLVELVMSHTPDVDVNVKNNDGQSPLLLAISYLSIDIVKLFLKHKADLHGLQFNEKDNKLFNYPYGNLTLRPLENLIAILDLFSSKGIVLKPKDNLSVLKFLLYDGSHAGLMNNEFKLDIFHMICVKPSVCLKSFLYNFKVDFEQDYLDLDEKGNMGYRGNSEEYLDYYYDLKAYLYCIEQGGYFVGKDVKTMIEETLKKCKVVCHYSPSLETEIINEELNKVNSIRLKEGIITSGDDQICMTMRHVLMKKPDDSASYFGINNFDESCLQKLDYYKGIVKGHVSLSLIRYYVIKLSYDIVTKFHSTSLSYACYERIIKYLSNKDILNWCLALVP